MPKFTIGTAIGIAASVAVSIATGNPFPAILGITSIAAGLFLTPGPNRGPESVTAARVGVGNHRGEGEPIPMVYGEVEYAPLAISTLIDSTSTADTIERVYLLGWGPMKVNEIVPVIVNGTDTGFTTPDLIHRITINGLPLVDLDPLAKIATGLSTSAGTLEGFNEAGTPYNQTATKLDAGVQHLFEMHDSADAVHMVFDWPAGLLKVVSSGSSENSAGGIRFEYRLADTGGRWSRMLMGQAAASSASQPGASAALDADGVNRVENLEWLQTVPADGITKAVSGEYWIVGRSRSHIRKVAKFKFPVAGRYELRFTGLADDDDNDVRAATVGLMIEVNSGRLTELENVQLLGIKLHATPQLRGSEPVLRINALGREIVQLEDADQTVGWTDNAASIAHDLLLDDDGGLGLFVDSTEVHDGSGETWRTAADTLEDNTYSITPTTGGAAFTEKLGRCNIVIDSRATGREWLDQILACGRLLMYTAEGQFRVARDEDKTSSRTFESRANESGRYNIQTVEPGSAETSLRVKEIPQHQRHNKVNVRYRDRNRGWTDRTATEVLDATVGVSTPEVVLEVNALGVTTHGQALRMSKFLLEKSQGSRWELSWDVSWGDMDLLPLERVTVKADWPEWAADTMEATVLSLEYQQDGRATIRAREYVGIATGAAEEVPVSFVVLTYKEAGLKTAPDGDATEPTLVMPEVKRQPKQPKGKAKGFRVNVHRKVK